VFKRVRWMGMGAVAGLSASAWAQRRLRRTLEEHPTIQAGADAASTARWVTREVRAAFSDGRSAMADREASLRAEVAARVDPSSAGRRAVAPSGVRPRLRVVDATSSDAPSGNATSNDAPSNGTASDDTAPDVTVPNDKLPNAVRALGGPLPLIAPHPAGGPGELLPLVAPDGRRRS
jgi:hypothetical protein